MNSTYYISIIQFNLMWEKSLSDFPNRLSQLLVILKERNPDVILLQNISFYFFEKLGREMGYLGYKKYIPENYRECNLGNIIFSKTQKIGDLFIEYQKNTDHRGIFLVSLPFPFENGTEKIYIGVSSLDKLNYIKSYQLSQLNTLVQKNIDGNNCILGMDLNSLDYENLETVESWKDAWFESGTEKEKYTLNHIENYLTPAPFLDRPDRIWYRSGDRTTKKIDCVRFELIGRNSEHISSHFGIFCIFSY